MLKKLTKQQKKKFIKNILLIILGCFLLAAADAIFITPFNLVTGGIVSVGILVQYAFTAAGSDFQVVDIVCWVLQLVLLVVSFLCLGKKFTLRTLLASLIYPCFFSILYRIPMIEGKALGQFFADLLVSSSSEGNVSTAVLILAGIFGGAMIGGGVAVTYLADGSTGGFDVICVILARHTPIKESISTFIIDGSLVIIGMFISKDIALGLIGVLSAFVCAAAVQYVYVNSSSYIIADIISSNPDPIQDYVIKEMDRTTTVIQATGGYTGENKTIIRVAFSKRDLHAFREFIGKVDPKAFVTFTTASMINGEGFDPLCKNSPSFNNKNSSSPTQKEDN